MKSSIFNFTTVSPKNHTFFKFLGNTNIFTPLSPSFQINRKPTPGTETKKQTYLYLYTSKYAHSPTISSIRPPLSLCRRSDRPRAQTITCILSCGNSQTPAQDPRHGLMTVAILPPSLEAPPRGHALTTRSAVMEKVDLIGNVRKPKWCTAELGRLPDRHGAWAVNEVG